MGIRASMARVVSDGAGAPFWVVHFIPCHSQGLWLAVKLIAPARCLARTNADTAGVGVDSPARRTRRPWAERTRAASRANASAIRRVS